MAAVWMPKAESDLDGFFEEIKEYSVGAAIEFELRIDRLVTNIDEGIISHELEDPPDLARKCPVPPKHRIVYERENGVTTILRIKRNPTS